MIPAIIIGIALISIFIYFANNPFSSGIKKTDRIEIKNGIADIHISFTFTLETMLRKL